MKVTIALILGMGALLCHCAHAPHGPKWIFLGESGKGSAFYYDAETISHPAEGIVDIWVKVVPCESESIHASLMSLVECGIISFTEDIKRTENIAYSIVLYEVDCVQGNIIPAASHDYDERGTILESSMYDKEVMQQLSDADTSVQTGTIWAILTDTACETAGREAICSGKRNSKRIAALSNSLKGCASD